MLISFPGWMQVLKAIRATDTTTKSKLCVIIPMTYSHVHGIIVQLKEKGFIWTEQKGRINNIGLTKTGKKLCEHINEVINLVG